MTEILVNQPTPAPTKKMQAVAWTGLLSPVVAGFLVSSLPGLSEACGEEFGVAATVVGVSLVQGGVTFLAGYLKRNELTEVRP